MNPRDAHIDDATLAAAWLRSARDASVRAALEGVYAHVSREIEVRGPVCWASGRCCNFERAGHRLYVTGLEAAYTVVEAERAPEDDPVGLRLPTLGDVEDARGRGGCPFQRGNLCGAHAIKPLGCRVYFCDRSAQVWQQSLHEAALGDVRAMHDRFGIPYRYMEWRAALELVVGRVG
ncbi:MAG: YkgJ family cysteine cluster protein [Phycisphaerales bacterium]|nr:MAG: YkgJ family cysteine cluster protein [Phycisphaerales bacterium]